MHTMGNATVYFGCLVGWGVAESRPLLAGEDADCTRNMAVEHTEGWKVDGMQ